MTEPRLTILGVYRPIISKKTWRKQWRVTGEDTLTKEHFDRLVLIEAEVGGLDGPFKMSELGQMQLAYRSYRPHKQVGYDEALLSANGEMLIQRGMNCVQRGMNCVQGAGPLRFAVFLHLYDPDRPLEW